MGQGNVSFSGGEKTKAFFKNAGKGGVRAVDIGFFSTAKYPDGTSVAYVAAINEFGADFTHPGGTPYKIVGQGKALFIKKGAPGAVGVTKPHRIVIPQRPAIRAANKRNERVVLKILKDGVDPKVMTVSKNLAGRVGVSQQNAVKKSMRDLKSPKNAASTVRGKGGRNNPLTNTGTLIKSVTYKVIE